MKSAWLRPPAAVIVPAVAVRTCRRHRHGRKVGGILNRGGGLRRNEIVLELQHRRNVAERVAGLGIDRDAHQIVAGAVDQIAVGIDLEIAAAGIVGDAVERRHVVGDAGRLLHREEAVAVDRDVGARPSSRRDGALGGDRLLARKRSRRRRPACWASASPGSDPRSWYRCPCNRRSRRSRCCRRCSATRRIAPAGRQPQVLSASKIPITLSPHSIRTASGALHTHGRHRRRRRNRRAKYENRVISNT